MRPLYFAVCNFCLSTLAQAATLTVPEAFDIQKINGVEPSLFSLAKEKTITLSAGQNTLTLEYDELFESSLNDSHDKVQSEAYTLVFDVNNQDTLSLQAPDIQDKAMAEQYAKAPHFVIKNAEGESIRLIAVRAEEMSHLAARQAQAALLVAPKTATLSPAAPANTNTSTPTQIATPAATSAEGPPPISMLRFWWKHASPEERAAFLKEISE